MLYRKMAGVLKVHVSEAQAAMVLLCAILTGHAS